LANKSNYYPRTLRLQSWEVQSMEEVFKLSNPKFNIYGDNISIEFENL